MRSVAKDVLTLLGIAWLAIGVFEILRVFAVAAALPAGRLPRSAAAFAARSPAQEVGA